MADAQRNGQRLDGGRARLRGQTTGGTFCELPELLLLRAWPAPPRPTNLVSTEGTPPAEVFVLAAATFGEQTTGLRWWAQAGPTGEGVGRRQGCPWAAAATAGSAGCVRPGCPPPPAAFTVQQQRWWPPTAARPDPPLVQLRHHAVDRCLRGLRGAAIAQRVGGAVELWVGGLRKERPAGEVSSSGEVWQGRPNQTHL